MDINQFIKHISNKELCFYMIILLQDIVFGEVHVILTRKIMLWASDQRWITCMDNTVWTIQYGPYCMDNTALFIADGLSAAFNLNTGMWASSAYSAVLNQHSGHFKIFFVLVLQKVKNIFGSFFRLLTYFK